MVVRSASPIFGTSRGCPEPVRTADFGERSTNGASVRGTEQDLATRFGIWGPLLKAERRLSFPDTYDHDTFLGRYRCPLSDYGLRCDETLKLNR